MVIRTSDYSGPAPLLSDAVVGAIFYDNKLETYFIVDSITESHNDSRRVPIFRCTKLVDYYDVRGRFSATYVKRETLMDGAALMSDPRYSLVNAGGTLGPRGNLFHFKPIDHNVARQLASSSKARSVLFEPGRVYEDSEGLYWSVVYDLPSGSVLLVNQTKAHWMSRLMFGGRSMVDQYREVAGIDLLTNFTFPKERSKKKRTVEIGK